MVRWLWLSVSMVMVAACTVPPSSTPGASFSPKQERAASVAPERASTQAVSYRATRVGELENPALREASGLAPSRRGIERLWVLNDGGDGARLYSIGLDGSNQGVVEVEGIRNEDWEDMASFRWNGDAYLLIADIGDNQARRSSYRLYFVREPGRRLPASVAVERTLTFVYEDGPRDAEAIAVDPEGERILILSKRDHPPRLYELPLSSERSGIQVAHYVTSILPLPQPSFGDILANPVLGRLGDVPTAMDISPDGRSVVVMTYRAIFRFHHPPGLGWREAFSRPPEKLATHALLQGEALAYGPDGRRIYYTSEHRPAPLWALVPSPSPRDSGERVVKQPADGGRADGE